MKLHVFNRFDLGHLIYFLKYVRFKMAATIVRLLPVHSLGLVSKKQDLVSTCEVYLSPLCRTSLNLYKVQRKFNTVCIVLKLLVTLYLFDSVLL